MSSSETESASSEVKALMEQCLARMEIEGTRALDEVCAAHPEHEETLRRWAAMLGGAGLVDDERATGDAAFPERFDEFRIVRKLGAGGMGVVYLAEQESVGRQVALKLVRPELLYFDKARARFQREVESAGRLKHPGIVSIHAVGEDNGVPYYAMELVDARSVAELLGAVKHRSADQLRGRDFAAQMIENGSESTADPRSFEAHFGGSWVETCCRVIREAAVAVEHAHQHGVLHRDLKPSNIMVTAEGRVVILDFGLASIEGAGKLTTTGSRIGSLDYMSPEQIGGDGAAPDRRADIYSLGVTLYEMLTLRSPFAADSAHAVRARILDGRPRRLREHNRRIPVDVETICLTAMDPDPTQRYASAGDLGRDLANFLALRPIQARRSGPVLRLRRWARRNRALAIASSAAVLALLAGTVVSLILKFEADASAASARLAADRSQQDLRLALRAIDEMLTEIGAEELNGVPQASPVRRAVLEKAAALLETLDARHGSLELRVELATAYGRVATLRWLVGDTEESEAAQARQLAILGDLLAMAPGRTDIRTEFAGAHTVRADYLRARAKPGEALQALQLALPDLEKLRETNAGDPERAWLLAEAVHAHGAALCDQGRAGDAVASLRRAIGLGDDACERHPAVERGPFIVAKYRTSLGVALIHTGQDANKAFAAARDLLERFLVDHAGDRLAQAQLGEVLLVSANRLRGDEARRAHERCVDVFRSLTIDFPRMPSYRSKLGRSLNNRAVSIVQREPEAAHGLLVQAIEEQQRAIAGSPGSATFKGFLGKHYTLLAYTKLATGRAVEVWDAVERMVEFAPASGVLRGTGREIYSGVSAAGFLVRAMSVLEEQPELSAENRAEMRERHGRRSVELLRRSAEKGFRNIDILDSVQFALLHDRPDFRALRAELARERDG